MKPSRKRILVADCHEDVLMKFERLLEDAGFDTTTVWSAKEALKLLELHDFDLVLLNDYLPDAECGAVLTALQRRGDQTPCILMQSRALEIADFTQLKHLGQEMWCANGAFRGIVEIVRGRLLWEPRPGCLIASRKRLWKVEWRLTWTLSTCLHAALSGQRQPIRKRDGI